MLQFLKKALAEPLTVFTVLGSALFAIDAANRASDRPLIAVDQQQIGVLASQREVILGRPMTGAERARLANDIRIEEMLVHEAVNRGLHLTDAKVRQRLAAKMYFLIDEPPPDPTKSDLDQLHAKNPSRYMTPELVTFEHLFFPESRVRAARALVQRSADRRAEAVADDGALFWLGRRMEYYNESQVAAVLGRPFAKALRDLPTGEWAGPIQSVRGWHLVRLDQFHRPEPLAGNALRELLVQDWNEQYREDVRARKLAEIAAGFRVQPEPPSPMQNADASATQ